MSMTNDELRQAIDDAFKMANQTGPARDDLRAHLRALLAERQRRAAMPAAPVLAPAGPLWVQPVIVQPTWVPGSTGNPPWKPPFEITCGTQ